MVSRLGWARRGVRRGKSERRRHREKRTKREGQKREHSQNNSVIRTMRSWQEGSP